MAPIFDVSAVIHDYKLPLPFRIALECLLADNIERYHRRARITSKSLSAKTKEVRARAICRSFLELHMNGQPLRYPQNINKSDVQILVNLWVRLGHSGGTIENKLTHLRAFGEWIGTPELVGTLSDYIDRESHGLVRSHLASRDKSWDGSGVNAMLLIEQVARTDPNVAVQLKLQMAFGLKVGESFLLKPKQVLRDKAFVNVMRGTIGCHARSVPFELQYAVLTEAARLSNKSTGTTMRQGLTTSRWRNVYYAVLNKHGIANKMLGITSLGLRHQYLQDVYERSTSMAAPVKGTSERAERDSHRAAMRRVVQAAGLSREIKASRYLLIDRVRVAMPEVTAEQAQAALANALGIKSHAAKSLGISRQTLYRRLENGSQAVSK